MSAFHDELYRTYRGLNCAGSSEADHFEWWWEDICAGRLTEAQVMQQIRARYTGTGNDDLIAKFEALTGTEVEG